MKTGTIKSFSQFSINESGLQNFSNLIKHLAKFSWTKVSIDDECKRSIDEHFGKGIFERVNQKAEELNRSIKSVDFGYIEDRLNDILDERDWDQARILFGVASNNFRHFNIDDPKLDPNFSDKPKYFLGDFTSYSQPYTEQEEFVDILISHILIKIVDYGARGVIDPKSIDKCLNFFLPYVEIQILNPESKRFNSGEMRIDIEDIMPSILPIVDHCGLIWPTTNNWAWEYRVKILLN